MDHGNSYTGTSDGTGDGTCNGEGEKEEEEGSEFDQLVRRLSVIRVPPDAVGVVGFLSQGDGGKVGTTGRRWPILKQVGIEVRAALEETAPAKRPMQMTRYEKKVKDCKTLFSRKEVTRIFHALVID